MSKPDPKTKTLPTVTVVGSYAAGTPIFSFWLTAVDTYSAVLQAALQAGLPTSGPDDPSPEDQDYNDALQWLRQNEDYLNLPTLVKMSVELNRMFAIKLQQFLSSGGHIKVGEITAAGQFSGMTIELRRDIVEQAHLFSNDSADHIYNILVHEIGHWQNQLVSPWDAHTAEESAQWMLEDEIRAALYMLMNWQATEGQVDVSGGDVNYGYLNMYNDFLSHHDLNRLISEMKAQFLAAHPGKMEEWRQAFNTAYPNGR